MAGIAAPTANGAFTYDEGVNPPSPADWSNFGATPTQLGPLSLGDSLHGTVGGGGDVNDFVHVQTPHTGPISLSFAATDTSFIIDVFNGTDSTGTLLAHGGGSSGSLSFAPSGTDYVIGFGNEGIANMTYSLSVAAVPEASNAVPLLAVLGLAAFLNKRK